MYKSFRLLTVVILIMLLPNCEDLDSILNEDETTEVDVEAANTLVAEANEIVFDDLRGLTEEEISEDAYDTPGTVLSKTI